MTENIDITGLEFGNGLSSRVTKEWEDEGSSNTWMSVHFRDFFYEFTIF
jgi:hypothetical protein